jgi:hypothetical protein
MKGRAAAIRISLVTAVLIFATYVSPAQNSSGFEPLLPIAYGPTVQPTVEPELRPGQAIVTDDLTTTEDLSRGEDLDSQDERMLVIRWKFSGSDYTDFHVYVKTQKGSFVYLGRTTTGDVSYLVWANEELRSQLQDYVKIKDQFEDGPQFGQSYMFKVYGITTAGKGPVRGPLLTKGFVEFKEKPAEVDLQDNTVIVTDDLSTTENLAPEEGGVDYDAADERMLVIRWKFAESDYKDFHVDVERSSVGAYAYLGKTKSGRVSYLVWAKGAAEIQGVFKNGPQFGESYKFKVFGMTRLVRPLFRGPLETAGAVQFLEQEPPTPTPVPTSIPELEPKPGQAIVTDDLSTMEDLSNGQDLDTPEERMLVIRWKLVETDYTDFHVYVKQSHGPYVYLGKAGKGQASYLVWAQGAPGIHKSFSSGPKFGETYQFKVYSVIQGRPSLLRKALVTAGPVRFLPMPPQELTPLAELTVEPVLTPLPIEEPTQTPVPTPTPTESPTVTPSPTPTPAPEEVPVGKAIVTDDLSTMEDLSGSEDLDTDENRMLVIRWRFDPGDYHDFHVYVKQSRGNYTFLGRTGTGSASYLVWAKNAPGIQVLFRNGPQFGETYQFRVYAIGIKGGLVSGKALVTNGPVRFNEESPGYAGQSDEPKEPGKPEKPGHGRD